jgi:hypothetical protein
VVEAPRLVLRQWDVSFEFENHGSKCSVKDLVLRMTAVSEPWLGTQYHIRYPRESE